MWIQDLSAPERLFDFQFGIPLMSPPFGIPLLTLFMGFCMFIQQKMMPPPPDSTQGKLMMLLPLGFTIVFMNFPAGLVLYWLIHTILSILQQYWVLKGSR
jgi:YidC/Oxa1 family membrane protein insertase